MAGDISIMQRGAILCGPYRYTLWRIWNEQLPRALFVLLNPSTADVEQDDPTLRRCIRFAQQAHCGSLEIVNLFALRSTQPVRLKQASTPIGPENDHYIVTAAERANFIVLGWGTLGTYLARDQAVLHLLSPYQLHCCAYTKAGNPKHPLYCRYTPLLPFSI